MGHTVELGSKAHLGLGITVLYSMQMKVNNTKGPFGWRGGKAGPTKSFLSKIERKLKGENEAA